jgi:hypothetical protein
MNKKFVLTLLSSPLLFASVWLVLLIAHPAGANQSPQTHLCCVRESRFASLRPCLQTNNSYASARKPQLKPQQNFEAAQGQELDFTEEESDAAIAIFGCDCPVCVNAIRQMRGLAPLPV